MNANQLACLLSGGALYPLGSLPNMQSVLNAQNYDNSAYIEKYWLRDWSRGVKRLRHSYAPPVSQNWLNAMLDVELGI